MSKKLDDLGVSAFCESMAMMLGSGIQTDEAIGLLQQSSTDSAGTPGGRLDEALKVMGAAVEEGSGLHVAMERSGAFPDYALKMTEAGERSGRLEDVLRRLSVYYAEQKTIGDKLKNAVRYPLLMLVLIIAVLAVMLTVVLPEFTSVYDNLTGSLTASSYGYIQWAYGFCLVALIVMVLLAAAMVVGLVLWKYGQRSTVEAILRKIPLCGKILENMGMFRFTSALATFLASGELQDIAVRSSMEMVDYAPVEKKLEKCLDQMDEGHSLAQAAYDEALFEPVYGRMLLAGERSGNMDSALERLTTLLEENCGTLVDRLVSVVDPILSGGLMITVGLTLLSVMLPLIGMMNAIG